MGQVPNTNTFSLWDVVDAMSLMSNSSLQDCFDEANPDGFDSLYEGDHDRLSNFRNYDHDVPFISIDPTELLNVPAAGGTYYIDLSTNASWSSTPSDSWISRSPSSGSSSTTVTVTIAANSGTGRLGWITFSISGKNATLSIQQLGTIK